MQRRAFLGWGGILSLSALFNSSIVARAVAAMQSSAIGWRRVRPGEAGWPGQEAWSALNQVVQGRLSKVTALFAPCAGGKDNAACVDVFGNLRNPFYLGDQPGAAQVSGWFNAWTPAPSAYAIEAHSAADIVAGVNFARDHRLRLVVKATGHSYQGTSNAADSLLIWTRAMKKITLHDQFVPTGCAGLIAPLPAVSAEAGAVWIDVYHAVTTLAGRFVTGGGCTDVGVAGLIQSGGFSSFSKGFGSAASNLLEAEIVTADGALLVVNAHNHPELFWALKGGGGGSWGVVTRVTLRSYDLPEYFGSAWGRIKAGSDLAYRRLIERFLTHYASHLLNPHWGEQVNFGPDNVLGVEMVCQGIDRQQALRDWQPFFDWIEAHPQDYSVVSELGTGVTRARGWWDIKGNDSMIADPRPGAPDYYGWWKGDQGQVGVFIHGYDSLWLPASLLTPHKLRDLADALFESSRHKKLGLHFNKGLAGAPDVALRATRDTATNPVLCQAFALVIIADGEKPAYPGQPGAAVDQEVARSDARQIDLATAALTRLVPNPGSYVSESNYFNPRWQHAFWGDHYARLQAVKQQYDPDGLFFVHHGVGSEQWDADGFVRVA